MPTHKGKGNGRRNDGNGSGGSTSKRTATGTDTDSDAWGNLGNGGFSGAGDAVRIDSKQSRKPNDIGGSDGIGSGIGSGDGNRDGGNRTRGSIGSAGGIADDTGSATSGDGG